MGHSLIEVYPYLANPFWLVFGLALVVLIPLVAPTARRVAFAAINLVFLGLVLRLGCLGLLAALLVVFVALKIVETRKHQILAIGAVGLASLALFLDHKLPSLFEPLHLGPLNAILATIGYSYVMLRMVELLRAVAEGRHPAPGLLSLINYLLPFHMLAAGPIQAYDDFIAQPAVPPRLGFEDALAAVERITTGLLKKFVLAQATEDLCLSGFRSEGFYFFLEVQFYYLWVYLDFSAYSDIAFGIGRLLGVVTPENFNRPYSARNLIDFWERWHISLSQFIRRNLFTPIVLELMRRSEGRRPIAIASLAFLFSFLLCGLWHGISARFLFWGAFHALGLIVCNLYKHLLGKKLGREGVKNYLQVTWIRMISMFLTYEFVAFSLLIVAYRADVEPPNPPSSTGVVR